jgi:hypothetical protein
MRYWTAAATLQRAREFWLPLMGVRPSWQDAKDLSVLLHAGSDVNAYYDRGSLSFHIATITDHTRSIQVRIGTGESPDIVAHEFGHAVLDALRPELWDATFTEVAAFHESFGDISALLTALTIDDLEKEFAALPGTSVFQSSRVSRLGEQMGWALRQQRPDLPDRDCLRDAVNTFFYVKPETLPTTSPSSSLSSEPHNFSRVFTAAFMRLLDEMLKAQKGPRTRAKVRRVAGTAASLLVNAVTSAPIVDAYYHSLAMAMVDAASTEQRGKYRRAVVTAFVRTGIISVQEAATGAAATTTKPRGAAGDIDEPVAPRESSSLRMDLSAFGFDTELTVDLGDSTHGDHHRGAAAGIDDPPADAAAMFFVEDLFRRNRLDLGSDSSAVDVPIQHSRSVTHTLHRTAGQLRIRRVRVDCGFDVT